MSRERKDRTSNWLVERHADSLLHLAKITNFTAWSAVQSVLSFPKQMPDGLLDVTFPGKPSPDPFLIVIESYPEQDTLEQILLDVAMVLLSRRVLPDMLVVVLRPKGNLAIPTVQMIQSTHGLSELRLKVHVLNLWTLSAEELLAANDVGLIPWVPLTEYHGAPEAMLQTCRERIEQQARPEETGNLLAATRVMAEMRYNDPGLLSLLGGQIMSLEKIFNQSPTIQYIKAQERRQAIQSQVLRRLAKRFGDVPEELAAHVRVIEDQQRLDDLLDAAYECADLEAFRIAINQR